MAGRLNTILVVLSVPTLLSAAISIYWSRKRKSASTESTSESTSEATTESTSEATGELTTESSPHPLSHQVQCENHIPAGEEVTDSSSSTPAPVTEQSEVQERVSEADNCDNSVMQISDAVNPTSEAQVAPVPSNCATPPMASRLQRANGAAADGPVPDLSAKVEKDVIPKSKNKKQHQQQPSQQTDTGSKKNGSGKKGKNVTSGQSPASDAQSPPAAGGLPDSRSRQTHDSGGSVGAASLDSGTDVSSPASAADQKSSDRSVDSPGLFKSDASQGSPCNWVASDSHSEQFMPNLSQRMTANVVYQFEMPADLVGKLIGKGGLTIRSISSQSRARIVVNDYPCDNYDHLKICTVDGDRLAIAEALRMIRACFPVATFPNLTLSQINAVPIATTQLYLMDGYPNDVMMSSLVSAGQFFLQQPCHASHDSLTVLNHMMAVTYGEQEAPAISSPTVGIIVAATVPALPGWYRAMIIGVSEDEAFCDVKYVDYGGCSRLETSSLRQIRMDFMNLPFQACECYLADVLPAEGETWSVAATECFEKLAQGCILKAIVAGMTEDGCTLVRLYKTQGMSNVCINEELVNRGLARWIQPPPASTSASE